jgi:hypothetical protein
MNRKKTMIFLAGAGLVLGLALLSFLPGRPGASLGVKVDGGEHQAALDHLTVGIEETVERGSIDGYQLRGTRGVQRRQPEASFKVMFR